MNYTDEQIRQAVELLPEGTQDMLFGPTLENAVSKIGQDSGLNSDQLVALNSVVNFTIMRLIKKEDLPSEILKILTASAEETSKKISSKIDSQILMSLIGAISANSEPMVTPTPQTSLPATAENSETEVRVSKEIPVIVRTEPIVPDVLPVVEPRPNLTPENLPVANENAEHSPALAMPSAQPTEQPAERKFVPNNQALESFDEKMKRIFTESGTNTIPPDTTKVAGTAQKTDPYREPIE